MPKGTTPGYHIGRDEAGLTERQREVLAELRTGADMVEIGRRLGVKKQRVKQLVDELEKKGALRRVGETLVLTQPRNS
jgi:DNA-binding CsgD family transcriptional regulator